MGVGEEKGECVGEEIGTRSRHELVTGGSTISLSGVGATGSVGLLTVNTTGDVNVPLAGISATGSAGTVTANAGEFTPSEDAFFYYSSESDPCNGSDLPNPPFWTQNVDYRGETICDTSPHGSRHIQFTTVQDQQHHYTEIHNTQDMPVSCSLGTSYYLAYFKRFDRTGSPLEDVWHTSGSSGDKGFEFRGNGVRWEIGRGSWSSFSGLDDHTFSVWMGNPSHHLNPGLESFDTFVQNKNGYSSTNPYLMYYETWYAMVMEVKMATDQTGAIGAWVNGTKVIEYIDIYTAEYSGPTITDIVIGGTIAQGAYDAPPHYRKFDGILLTDNWNDVINGGYLQDPEA